MIQAEFDALVQLLNRAPMSVGEQLWIQEFLLKLRQYIEQPEEKPELS